MHNIILDYMGHVIRTVLKFYQEPFSKEWDSQLNMLIVFGTVVNFDCYTVTFEYNENHYEVWRANKYYSYGYLQRHNRSFVPDTLQFRPKFKTMLRLNKLVASLHEPSK